MWLIEEWDWDRSSWPVRWFRTRDEADRWLMEYPPGKDDYGYRLTELLDDGAIGDDCEWVEYVPDRYYGPTVTAKIDLAQHTINHPGYAHRVPIDCIQAYPEFELTVDQQYRILEAHTTSGVCNCAGWQLVEGSPEKIAELVAEYPHEETSS